MVVLAGLADLADDADRERARALADELAARGVAVVLLEPPGAAPGAPVDERADQVVLVAAEPLWRHRDGRGEAP